MFVQLPLKIGLREEVCFETYVAESEELALALGHYQQSLSTQQEDFFYICGSHAVGKTHLLQASCRFMTDFSQTSAYLPFADTTFPLVPEVLKGLENTYLVCLDDVDLVIGDAQWEMALSELIYKSQALGHRVILSGQYAFDHWSMTTQTLRDAMIAFLSIELSPLVEKANLIEAIQRHALKMGFELSIDVANYLVKQFSTDLAQLLSVLQFIEQSSMIEKRRVTLPFVKQVLMH